MSETKTAFMYDGQTFYPSDLDQDLDKMIENVKSWLMDYDGNLTRGHNLRGHESAFIYEVTFKEIGRVEMIGRLEFSRNDENHK